MKIRLDVRRSAMENAQALFAEAKKYRRKAEGARKAIGITRSKIARLGEPKAAAGKEGNAGAKKGGRKTGKRKWFGEYRHFTTTNGFLCAGGKNAKQNDLLVAGQLKEGDLFFHADVHGASAVVLKDGLKAQEKDLQEAAQFAACYSNAWKSGAGTADVYSVRKEQVSKHSHGEFLGKGAFLISGEKQWFKNVELVLALMVKGGELKAEPGAKHLAKGGGVILVRPGGIPKEDFYKQLKRGFLKGVKTTPDEFYALLPGNAELA